MSAPCATRCVSRTAATTTGWSGQPARAQAIVTLLEQIRLDIWPAMPPMNRGCRIPEGLLIGDDAQFDTERSYRTEDGVVLITQQMLAEN